MFLSIAQFTQELISNPVDVDSRVSAYILNRTHDLELRLQYKHTSELIRQLQACGAEFSAHNVLIEVTYQQILIQNQVPQYGVQLSQ